MGGGYALPTLDNGVFALLLQIFANGNSATQQAEQHARDDVDAIQGKDIGVDIHYGEEGGQVDDHLHQAVVGIIEDCGGDQAGDDADDDAFHNEGHADKAIGGAHGFHDVDFHAAGEDSHLHGIGDDEQGHHRQNRHNADAAVADHPVQAAEGLGHVAVVGDRLHPFNGGNLADCLIVDAQIRQGNLVGIGQGVVVAGKAVKQGAAAVDVLHHAGKGCILGDKGALGDVVNLADFLADAHGRQGRHVGAQVHGDDVVALHRLHGGGDIQGEKRRHAGHQQAGDKHANGGDTHGAVFPKAFQALAEQVANAVQAHCSTSSLLSSSRGICSRRICWASTPAFSSGASSPSTP